MVFLLCVLSLSVSRILSSALMQPAFAAGRSQGAPTTQNQLSQFSTGGDNFFSDNSINSAAVATSHRKTEEPHTGLFSLSFPWEFAPYSRADRSNVHNIVDSMSVKLLLTWEVCILTFWPKQWAWNMTSYYWTDVTMLTCHSQIIFNKSLLRIQEKARKERCYKL